MDNKINLEVVRTLTVPLSAQRVLMKLYDLAESGWGIDNSWDSFMEMAQTIIRQETRNSYLELDVHYVDDGEGE